MRIRGFRAHSSDKTHAVDSYSVAGKIDSHQSRFLAAVGIAERIVTAKCGARFYVDTTNPAQFVTSTSAPICRECVRVIDEQQARIANAK